MSRMLEQVNGWWKAEATRHFLWLPVVFAIGIAIYYHLPSEPAPEVLPALSLGLLGLMLALRKRALPVMFALFMISLGATWTQMRTVEDHSPVVLKEGLSPRPITGVVRDIERTEHGVRLLLDKVTVDDLPPAMTPTQIRLSVRLKKGAEFELPHVGDGIEMRAGLLPPMGPALPNGFDFARYFSFRDIGAVGYGLPPWNIIAPEERPGIMNRFWTWRTRMTDDIVKQLGPGTGGVAAGFITGDARAISDEDFSALRASNLYHIIAISGEHMVVITGVIFLILRTLLLLLPARISLRPESKPIIAIITLALVTIYLFVTGLPMSAVRAYFMIVLVLLAVILRRQVDPMRSLAITAFIMLVNDPASLLDPGFQLSFAATLALISLIEVRVVRGPRPDMPRARRVLYHFASLMLVSFVAECATEPLVISMFNNTSPYGIFANTLATPLVSFFLMPLVALFFVLLPFGLKHVALVLMSYGIDALMWLGRWVASFPHAQLFCPSLPGWGLAIFALGLVWVCLWKTRVRRYGVVACVVGVLSLLSVSPPDVLVGGTLKQIAFRGSDGFVLARGRAGSMLPEMWANGLGYTLLEKADEPEWRCDGLGCIAKVKSATIAFPHDIAALGEDCQHAQVIVISAAATCNTGALVLDPKKLAGSSVTALWVKPDGKVHVETSAQWQGQRPWSIGPADLDED